MKAQWTLGTATVAAVLNWIAGFGWHALTPDEAATVIVAVNAVAALVVAWKTRPVAPSVWTYVVTSVAAVLAAYGLHFTQGSVSAFSTLVLAVVALITHGQVSPASDVRTAPRGKTVLRDVA